MIATRVAPPPREAGARYFAWLYTPAHARDGTAALLALEHEIMTSARADLDHAVAHARLAWWHEECARLALGSPRHPASIVARDAFRVAGLAAPDLGALAELAARSLAHSTLGRERAAKDEAADAAQWAEALLLPLAGLACPAALTEPAVARLGAALYRHQAAPTATLRTELREALRALPPALTTALRGIVVWATLALRSARDASSRREALAETWFAWRAARRAHYGRT